MNTFEIDINEREHIVTKIEKCKKDIRGININIAIATFLMLGSLVCAFSVPSKSYGAPSIRFFALCLILGSAIYMMTAKPRKEKLKEEMEGLNFALKLNEKERRNGNKKIIGDVKTYKNSTKRW